MRFRIERSPRTGQYWFRIKSGSDILASSEQYVSKQSAKNAIASIKVEAASAQVIDNT